MAISFLLGLENPRGLRNTVSLHWSLVSSSFTHGAKTKFLGFTPQSTICNWSPSFIPCANASPSVLQKKVTPVSDVNVRPKGTHFHARPLGQL